jgi:hypothetical protein
MCSALAGAEEERRFGDRSRTASTPSIRAWCVALSERGGVAKTSVRCQSALRPPGGFGTPLRQRKAWVELLILLTVQCAKKKTGDVGGRVPSAIAVEMKNAAVDDAKRCGMASKAGGALPNRLETSWTARRRKGPPDVRSACVVACAAIVKGAASLAPGDESSDWGGAPRTFYVALRRPASTARIAGVNDGFASDRSGSRGAHVHEPR